MSRNQGHRGAGLGKLGGFSQRVSGLFVPKPKKPDPIADEIRAKRLTRQVVTPQRQIKYKNRMSDDQLHHAKMKKKRRAANKTARRARRLNRMR